MRFKLIKVFVIFFFLVSLVLALPEFKISAFGESFTYPSVGFSKIGIPKDFKSFSKGEGLYPVDKVSTNLNFTGGLTEDEKKQEQDKIYKKVVERLDFNKNFSDIRVEKAIEGSIYRINFYIPQSYTDTKRIAELLTAPGEIQFINISDFTVNLHDYDVENAEFSERVRIQTSQSSYSDIDFLNLTLIFDNEKETDLTNLFTVLNIANQSSDSEEAQTTDAYVLIDNKRYDIAIHESKTNAVRIYPQDIFLMTDNEARSEMEAVQSYLNQDSPIETNITVMQPVSLKPDFNAEGGTYIALAFIVSAVLVSLLFLANFKLRGSIFYSVLISMGTLLSVVIGKTVGISLSMNMVAGFIIGYLLLNVLCYSILRAESKDEMKEVLNKCTINALAIILGIYSYIQISPISGSVSELFEMIVIFAISIMILNVSFYRLIAALYLDKIKKYDA